MNLGLVRFLRFANEVGVEMPSSMGTDAESELVVVHVEVAALLAGAVRVVVGARGVEGFSGSVGLCWTRLQAPVVISPSTR